jgi:hypothetical protein
VTALEGELLPPDESWFRVGDVVTRDGTDEHLVVGSNEDPNRPYPPDLIDVVCIKPPEAWLDGTVWARIGDKESNLPRRYRLVRRFKPSTASPAIALPNAAGTEVQHDCKISAKPA